MTVIDKTSLGPQSEPDDLPLTNPRATFFSYASLNELKEPSSILGSKGCKVHLMEGKEEKKYWAKFHSLHESTVKAQRPMSFLYTMLKERLWGSFSTSPLTSRQHLSLEDLIIKYKARFISI